MYQSASAAPPPASRSAPFPRLPTGNQVHLSLNRHRPPLFFYFASGRVQPIQQLTLAINLRLRRIHVLSSRLLICARHLSTRKTKYPSPPVCQREHYSVPKPVIISPFHYEPGSPQIIHLKIFFFSQIFHQKLPFFGRVPQSEGLQRVFVYSSPP